MKAKSIKIFKNKVIKNNKGNITKFVTKKSKFFSGFGEVYFSELKKNKSKGWNIHLKNQCILTVIQGDVKFTFYNPKKKKNKIQKLIVSKN